MLKPGKSVEPEALFLAYASRVQLPLAEADYLLGLFALARAAGAAPPGGEQAQPIEAPRPEGKS